MVGLVSPAVALPCSNGRSLSERTSAEFPHEGDHRSDFRAYSPLSDKYRVLSFDYRGHGRSSRTKPYTFAQIVDDIEELRRRFAGDGQKSIICGGSFGGFLAQQYAIKYPDRISHLILRGTAPSYHRKCALANSRPRQRSPPTQVHTGSDFSIAWAKQRKTMRPSFWSSGCTEPRVSRLRC